MKEKEQIQNEMRIKLPSLSVNESVARSVVAAFCAQLDPSTSALADIKCVVSEAVTNCIVHGYKNEIGIIYIHVKIFEGAKICICIKDKGCGISDIKKAMEPLYTSSETGERAGLGFSIMESFMDKIRVRSKPGKGTSVTLEKSIVSKGK